MQSLLRQAVARACRSKPWRGLSKSPAEAEASFSRLSNPLLSRALTRRSPPALSGLCRQCQMRSYSITTTSQETVAKERKRKESEPLRILFCGSDEFSCASLEALHQEHVRNPKLIQSIDVVVRPGKRTGRGYKVVKHPPIRELAEKLGLPIHERDTFTGWNMPSHTNLIIAVSFGLFVPPRLLQQAKYGGLNVHPSLLPDLRGPAPLQHALLAGRSSTGVSLQTLDAARFDHGLVLARTPPLPIPEDCDFATLLQKVTPVAAELLVNGLRDGVHVPPLEEESFEGEQQIAGGELIHAPKITKQDLQIRPEHLPHLLRRHRALGPLWFWSRDRQGVQKRIILEKFSTTPDLLQKDLKFCVTEPTASSTSSDLTGLARTVGRFVDGFGPAEAGGFRALPFVSEPGPKPEPEADIGAGEKDDKNKIENKTENNSSSSSSSSSSNSSGSSREKSLGSKWFVVWIPERDNSVCYMGPYRVETVKVEGDKARPAPQGLKEFFVP
ncbi:Formyltransferase [Hypoxylon sp. FL1857]|nr:Formyltransferase [Hypoxylon sp. FL1857]